MTSATRSKYQGTEPTIVIGIDIGTTFSGASYAMLVPNEVPTVHDVVRFEGQQKINSAKVPSIIYYDGDGRALARGAEIDDLADSGSDSDGDDEESSMRVKVEWFKLHLRPASSKLSNEDLPPMHLPKNGTVVDVWSEFLQYMNESIQRYIEESEVDGKSLLDKAKDTVRYVLTHPNDWKGHQQDQIRKAAVRAKLVPDTLQGRSRIEFLSEGEASFHWCVEQKLLDRALEVGNHIIICDAGGGTIDVSSFHVTSLEPLKLEEAAESEARVAGSVFVTNNFYYWALDQLKNTRYGSEKNLLILKKKFDSSTKCTFKDRNKQHRIKFGRRTDNDEALHIQHGHFVVPGDTLASFFEMSCQEAVAAVRNHLKGGEHSHIFVVGGFSNSSWLYSEIARRLASEDCDVYRFDSLTAKPVAHGSVTSHIDHLIHSRVAKDTYIATSDILYDDTLSEHRARKDRVFSSSFGPALGDALVCFVQRGDLISDGSSVRRPGWRTATWKPTEVPITVDLIRYSGKVKNIAFRDQDAAEAFKTVCTFSGKVSGALFRRAQAPGEELWRFDFEAVLILGGTEIQCFIEWEEDGEKKRSKANSAWLDL